MMFKVSSEETPEYIRSLFTRSTSKVWCEQLISPRPRIDLYRISLAFSGSHLTISSSLNPQGSLGQHR